MSKKKKKRNTKQSDELAMEELSEQVEGLASDGKGPISPSIGTNLGELILEKLNGKARLCP